MISQFMDPVLNSTYLTSKVQGQESSSELGKMPLYGY